MRKITSLFIILTLSTLLTACIAYTSDLSPVQGKKDTFVMHISSSICNKSCSDAKAESAINEFMEKHGYSNYKIIKERADLQMSSKYYYTVRFYR